MNTTEIQHEEKTIQVIKKGPLEGNYLGVKIKIIHVHGIERLLEEVEQIADMPEVNSAIIKYDGPKEKAKQCTLEIRSHPDTEIYGLTRLNRYPTLEVIGMIDNPDISEKDMKKNNNNN